MTTSPLITATDPMAQPETPRRLGRGLDALLARKEPARETVVKAVDRDERPESALQQLPIAQIRPNPFQPRKEFEAGELADLESSLRSNGLLQPVTVRPAPNGDGYELIAGERRLRAATRLGWTEIAAIVRPTDNRAALTLAMVENLQRADLDPVEEADGYQRMIDDFALSQQEVADVVGKDRSTVANALRLHQLPAAVRTLLQKKQLSAGHARALLPLANDRAILALAQDTVKNGFSVREVERRVHAGRPTPAKTGRKAATPKHSVATKSTSATTRRIEEMLRRKLQTGVSLHVSGPDRGEVRIEFFSNDDLARLLAILGISVDD